MKWRRRPRPGAPPVGRERSAAPPPPPPPAPVPQAIRWDADAARRRSQRLTEEGSLAALSWTEDEGGPVAAEAPSPSHHDDGASLFQAEEDDGGTGASSHAVRLWTDEEESKVKTLPRTPTATPRSRRSSQDSRRPKKARRRGRRIAVWALGAVVVLFLCDLLYVGIVLRAQLTDAASHLDSLRTDLQAGRLAPARSALREAVSETDAADELLAHPALQVVAALPLVGGDADALQGIVAAARLVTDAAEPGLRAASLLDYKDGAIGSTVYEDGRINLDVLSETEPLLVQVEESLQDAEREVDEIGRAILPPIRTAVDDARDRVGEAASVATNAVSLLRTLPRLAGGNGERRYLLTFQALGEARATGGVAGLFGVLEARNGKIRLGRIDSYHRIFADVSPNLVPSWYRKTYGVQGALDEWPQANLSPNFPVDARVWLEMYRQTYGDELDGVIAVDAVALSSLMEGTGPFEIDGHDRPITSDNVVDVLSHDAYLDYPTQRTQNKFFSAVIRTFWDRIEEGDVDVEALARGVGEAAGTRHLTVFVKDQTARAQLEELEADGSIEGFGPNLQAVFSNNYAINKVDYYLHREIDTKIEIGDGGDLRVTTEVTLRNDAPDGPRSNLLGGIENNLPPGTNRQTVNFLVPVNAKVGGLTVDGKRGGSIQYIDSKHPIVWDVVTIPPGEESVVSLVYVVNGGASLSADGAELSFTLLPQPMLNVDELTATVFAPGGYVLSGGDESEKDLVVQGPFERPTTLTARFEPAS